MKSLSFPLFPTIISFMIPQVEGTSLDWSQWRGPTRDGYVKKGSPWPKSISKEKLRLLWRKELSKGDPGSMFVRELEAIAC